jgi:hypothetical protein
VKSDLANLLAEKQAAEKSLLAELKIEKLSPVQVQRMSEYLDAARKYRTAEVRYTVDRIVQEEKRREKQEILAALTILQRDPEFRKRLLKK